MDGCLDAERVRMVKNALCRLLRQAHLFCQEYPSYFAALRPTRRRRELKRYAALVNGLAEQFDRIIGMARGIRSLQELNFEQIEAQAETVRKAACRCRRELAETI